MTALHEQGLIEITHQDGARILAKITPEGLALLRRLRLQQARKAAAKLAIPPA